MTNLLSAILIQTTEEASPLTYAIFAVVMVAVVAGIIISQKKAASTIPAAITSRYPIKDVAKFGSSILVISDSKIVVQDNLKWFEFDASEIKRADNVYNPVMKEFCLSFYNEEGKLLKGPKVLGGGVAVKSTKSEFHYYHGGKNETIEQQGNDALRMVKLVFPSIEI